MPSRRKRWIFRWTAAAVLAVGSAGAPGAQQERERETPPRCAYRALFPPIASSAQRQLKAGNSSSIPNAGDLPRTIRRGIKWR